MANLFLALLRLPATGARMPVLTAQEQAIAAVIAQGREHTCDMGVDSTTLEMAQAVADKL